MAIKRAGSSSKTKAAAQEQELLALLREWKQLEDTTIKSCSNIVKKSKNQIVKTIVTSIKNDSVKHKTILQLVMNSMTRQGYVLSPDDLMGISSLLNRHITYEQKSIDTAKKAIAKSRDAITKQLLNVILEDEKRHKLHTRQMDELKFKITSKVT